MFDLLNSFDLFDLGLVVFLIFIIYQVFLKVFWKIEHFNSHDFNTYTQIEPHRYFENKNCCVVTKKFGPLGFYYEYKKGKCNQNYDFGINNIKVIEGDCEKLGSCRKQNFECIDFVNKEFSDKYKMDFSTEPCETPYNYVNELPDYRIS